MLDDLLQSSPGEDFYMQSWKTNQGSASSNESGVTVHYHLGNTSSNESGVSVTDPTVDGKERGVRSRESGVTASDPTVDGNYIIIKTINYCTI